MIRFEYQTYCNEYKIIKVSRKAYIIKYIDYYSIFAGWLRNISLSLD